MNLNIKKILENYHVLVSFLIYLSVLILSIFLNHGKINNDGVGYLVIANLLDHGDNQTALQLYQDLFYIEMILFVKNLFNSTIFFSAKFISYLSISFLVLLFILTLKKIFNKKNISIFAVTILITSIPLMDDYLHMIIRDHAAWLCLIVGIYSYISYLEDNKFFYVIIFFISMLLGFLIRIETVLLHLSLFILYFYKIYENNKNINNYVFIFVLIFFSLLLVFFQDFILERSHRVDEFIDRVLLIFNPLEIESQNYWLEQLINDNKIIFKLASLSGIFIYKYISLLGILNLFLLIAVCNLKFKYKKELILISIILLIPPFLNLLSTNVITSRYLMPSILFLYFLTSIGLYGVFTNSINFLNRFTHHKYLRISITMILFIFFINIFIDKQKSSDEKKIAELVASNNVLSLKNTYIDNMKIRFYLKTLDYQAPLSEESIQGLFNYQIINKKSSITTGFKYSNLNNSLKKNKYIILERINSE